MSSNSFSPSPFHNHKKCFQRKKNKNEEDPKKGRKRS
jgi:hypothetical protein